MENTLLVGLSRQVALARQLDVVANNVANLNTTGFKSDGSLFEEYIGPTARENGFRGADRNVRDALEDSPPAGWAAFFKNEAIGQMIGSAG